MQLSADQEMESELHQQSSRDDFQKYYAVFVLMLLLVCRVSYQQQRQIIGYAYGY